MAVKCPSCQFENPDDTVYCGKCAAPLKISEDIVATRTLEIPGDQLTEGFTIAGRYQIIEELGRGGMGRVYRVNDDEIMEEIALKFLAPEIASDEKTIERFRNELKLARKVSHKHVCRMFDIGKENDKYFITMEYVEGEDLRNYIRRNEKIQEKKALLIAKQVCEGLAEAHRQGVVHRDLKPSNIMIDKEGNAKIMDFGIARSVEAPGVTATGMIIGTPYYLSPEQVEGEEADNRSDIYSLGIILYEMVTGEVPFKGDTALSVALKHKTKSPTDPKKLNPSISESLGRLILICMEKDKKRRYQSATELLTDLRNIEKGYSLGIKIQPKQRTFVPASIVVLPFDDLSPNKDQDIQCEGLADTLITALNQLENLYIPARTSSFSFKGREKDYQEIGKKLNVDSILEGSIQKAGTQLRIAARIIKASDGKQIWGQLYSGHEKDIFRIQDQISFAIVDKLKVNLKGAERENLKKKYTKNIEAYNLYIKGRHFWNKRTKKELQRSIEYFKQAIDMDPTYALAYTGIADAFISLGTFFIAPREAFPKAKTAAKKALEIDEAICEAYTSLGTINFYYDWDWEAAENALKRAIELNPNYALAFYYYSFLLLTVGRFEESLKLASQAQELDPLSAIINTGATFTYTWLRQYDEAIERFHKILELDPYFLYGHIWLGNDYCLKGMYKKGIEELQKVLNIVEDMAYALIHLGWAYAVSGQEEEAIKVLDRLNELSKEKYVSPWGRATICVALGKIDQAFEFFEEAYLDREPLFAMCLSGPWYDEIRSDPRFKALLKKMNLSEKLPVV